MNENSTSKSYIKANWDKIIIIILLMVCIYQVYDNSKEIALIKRRTSSMDDNIDKISEEVGYIESQLSK